MSPLSPLVDVAGSARPLTATLRTPLLYDALAPVSNLLDAITLLAPDQYWETFALCALCFPIMTVFRQRKQRGHFSTARIARSAMQFLGATVAVVGIMLTWARPMASLTLNDADSIAVDFHSHTEASHDGRPGFTPERNREWHEDAGFNAAYITDHRTFAGALEGGTKNPAASGEGTVLLSGVELRDGSEHPILIGVDPRRMKITSPDWQGAAVAADGGPVPPILLLSLPGDIGNIPEGELAGAVRLAGIEASDGSPLGLAQSARARDSILSASKRLGLALVSGTNNHGWGRAAQAWSVLRIPGWRGMSPAQLDAAIRRTILTNGTRAVQVIARRTAPPPGRTSRAALGGMSVGLVALRTMSAPQRASWIVWSWAICLLSLRHARGKQTRLRSRSRARVRKRSRERPVEVAATLPAAS